MDMRSGEAGEWLLEHLHTGVHITAFCLSSLKNTAQLWKGVASNSVPLQEGVAGLKNSVLPAKTHPCVFRNLCFGFHPAKRVYQRFMFPFRRKAHHCVCSTGAFSSASSSWSSPEVVFRGWDSPAITAWGTGPGGHQTRGRVLEWGAGGWAQPT